MLCPIVDFNTKEIQMSNKTLRYPAGLLLVVVPIVFTACFMLLQSQFEYPDILRQSTADVLCKFEAGGTELIIIWYILTLTALSFIPIAMLAGQVLGGVQSPGYLRIGTTFGIVAGLVQTLGFLRWPFLVPHLAAIYLDPASSVAQRETAALIFEAFHRYAGVAVGEHLGYLCTAAWTFLVGLALLRSAQFERWIGAAGMILAVGIAAGLLEMLGWELAGPINAVSYLAWAVWLIVIGGVLLLGRPVTRAVGGPAPIRE
jgi:hypothetical protein